MRKLKEGEESLKVRGRPRYLPRDGEALKPMEDMISCLVDELIKGEKKYEIFYHLFFGQRS